MRYAKYSSKIYKNMYINTFIFFAYWFYFSEGGGGISFFCITGYDYTQKLWKAPTWNTVQYPGSLSDKISPFITLQSNYRTVVQHRYQNITGQDPMAFLSSSNQIAYSPKIHFNFILPSTSRSSNWTSQGGFHQNFCSQYLSSPSSPHAPLIVASYSSLF
jgi:hypothetical protein